jgi:riboflavin kinase/FMN adenylyltransferase
VIIARGADELPPGERAVTLGTFDGVHVGHQHVISTARATGLTTTVVTFWPHPRLVLGNRVELFAESLLRRIGTRVIATGENFRFGRGASGDTATLAELGFDVRAAPLVGGASSTAIRTLLQAGDVQRAAQLLGRPPEVEGTVVLGDQRGGTLGYPTANLNVPPELLVPAYGIYAGAAVGHRVAISIGVNPHYGGSERRIEPYLLDFDGDLYGRRLVVELWRRLRDERAFASEEELVAQIARDVEETRAAVRPA